MKVEIISVGERWNMMFRNGMLLIFILWVNFTWAGCRTTASLNITDSINVGEILANPLVKVLCLPGYLVIRARIK